MLRDESEIQQLSKGLKFFSHLFPIKDSTIVMDDLFTGLAKRATLEELPGSGYACKYNIDPAKHFHEDKFIAEWNAMLEDKVYYV